MLSFTGGEYILGETGEGRGVIDNAHAVLKVPPFPDLLKKRSGRNQLELGGSGPAIIFYPGSSGHHAEVLPIVKPKYSPKLSSHFLLAC
jgi:hypothetical protein